MPTLEMGHMDGRGKNRVNLVCRMADDYVGFCESLA